MNRIFHVKIAGGTYFLLILLTAVMVFAFWCMKAMIGLVVALGLIIIIERIIHSTYTLTADGKLVVYYGRFYKGKTIPLIDITDVEPETKFRIWWNYAFEICIDTLWEEKFIVIGSCKAGRIYQCVGEAVGA